MPDLLGWMAAPPRRVAPAENREENAAVKYLETTIAPLSELERFPGNARKHALERIKDSVRKGQYKSLLTRRLDDGRLVIVAGNGTADALEAVGAREARVEVWEYTDTEARWVNISDNRLSDLASDDDDALAALLIAQDGDYVGLGFTENEINKLLGTETMPEGGDAPVDDMAGNRWGVIVECGTEQEQIRLLTELGNQGLNVRSIMA
jgi:ParB-like chromosome segregation protein Spo0J